MSDIQHHADRQAFETTVDGLLCEAVYRLQPGRDGTVMVMHHTGVPHRLEGRGIASQLVGAAMAYARDNHLKVRPLCSYVQVYLRRHPEHADLLETR